MQAFTTLTSIATPLDRANVDTDAIIPKQFLKSIKRTGFGVHLFDEWRYLDHGELGMDSTKRPRNMDFVLNKPEYQDSTILLARENFGCGSSREHAPWALEDYGFRAIISSSFADIFYNNCFKNGILPIVLSTSEVDTLFHINTPLTIDLVQQTVSYNDTALTFDIDGDRKRRLLGGLDDIGITLEYKEQIQSFEKQYLQTYSWV